VTVHLVGAGPGDPDLLTVRAADLLRRADVVVHDRLIDPRVLELAPPWAEMVDVGKRPGDPRNPQDTINEVLVDRGRRYDCVVRLKGGDPYVFGRGGEEAVALRDAGVEVAEVPGITSAIAAPAAAGIPVTMRGVSSGFTVVTAHQDPTTDRWLDWDALARTRTTLVILMGARRTVAIANRLRAGGMAPDTPVAIIHAATTTSETVQRATLAELPELTVVNPSTLVVGAVAAADVVGGHPLPELTHELTQGIDLPEGLAR
jgi:uroporphyrin-III C-methyltransferase